MFIYLIYFLLKKKNGIGENLISYKSSKQKYFCGILYKANELSKSCMTLGYAEGKCTTLEKEFVNIVESGWKAW